MATGTILAFAAPPNTVIFIDVCTYRSGNCRKRRLKHLGDIGQRLKPRFYWYISTFIILADRDLPNPNERFLDVRLNMIDD